MTQAAEQARRYGVLIASSTFPEEPKLNDLACPENDVDGLEKVLSDEAIGGFSELLVVKNEPSHAALRKVHKVLRKAGRDDFVLIYYAGHGKTDLAGRLHLATTETVNEELETTSIPAQRIRALIDNARTTKVALILDCCYSGAIEKSFLRGDVEDQLNIMAGGRGTFIMTAATDVQTAREEIRDGYGIFTKHLIDGIRGAADVDGDGIVTMNELYDYVHREVIAESHQVPMKWNLNVQGEMVIAQSGRKPREERRKMLRSRLFALADKGLLPDMVFTRALEVSNLSYEETRQGAAARYDQLLDRVLDPDVHVGKFLDDWLQVPADDAPAPSTKHKLTEEAEPAAKEDPSTETEGAEKEKPAQKTRAKPKQSAKARPKRTRRTGAKPSAKATAGTQSDSSGSGSQTWTFGNATAVAGKQSGSRWTGFLICLAWIAAGIPFMVAVGEYFRAEDISYFHPYYKDAWRSDEESGVMTAAPIWAAFGWVLMRASRERINILVKGLYWLGILTCFAIAVAALSSI